MMQISSYLRTVGNGRWCPQLPLYVFYLDKQQQCIVDQLLGWNGSLRTGNLTKIKLEVEYEDNTN